MAHLLNWWEVEEDDAQLVPEKKDYFSDTCYCSHPHSDDSDCSEDSDYSDGSSTESDDPEDGAALERIRDPPPPWEHLSAERVRHQIRALKDPVLQKEFYSKLLVFCSTAATAIKNKK